MIQSVRSLLKIGKISYRELVVDHLYENMYVKKTIYQATVRKFDQFLYSIDQYQER